MKTIYTFLSSIELVDEASAWWRLYSVQIFAFISFMGTVQIFWPFLSWAFPAWIVGLVALLTGLAGIAARLIKQFNLTPAAEVK